MSKLFKKLLIVLCVTAVNFVPQTHAQDSCYNCNVDSLAQTLKAVKTDAEKVKLLKLLIDLNIGRINPNLLTDSSIKNYIGSLLELRRSEKIKDIDAYKSLLDAFNFFEKRDYLNGQNSLKKSIELFDLEHKKIPNLLWFSRFAYNLQGNQEDRYKFYSSKLKYYLINGPVENVAPCYHSLGGYYLYKADYNLAISNYLRAAVVYKNYDEANYRNDLGVVANAYAKWGNYRKALEYFNKIIPITKIARDTIQLSFIYTSLLE